MADNNWSLIIRPKNNIFNFGFKEIWRYRDLLLLFVKRDFVALYKQTILGPVWFFIQPVISAIVYTIIFSYFARINTEAVPPLLFYLGGLTLWNYFAECLTKTSDTFIQNQSIFGKVYFPRIIVPLSVTLSGMFKLLIQFIVFIACWIYYYYFKNNVSIHPQWTIVLVPFLILIISGLSLGFGIVFSSLTTKYRDIRFLLQFGVQLLMYVSSVIIPLSQIGEKHRWIIQLNPVVSIIETFKHAFFGTGIFDWGNLLYSFGFMLVVIFLGLILFNSIEKKFMDTV
jgi:lipopolysaccharide transport system permease protein